MKIASIVAVYPLYGGGLGVVAREHARMLVRDFDVTVYTPRYARVDESLREDGGVRVAFLRPLFSYGNAAFLPQLFWKLRAFDIIHLHYPFFGGCVVTIVAALVWRKKLVITYHMDLFGKGGAFRLLFSIANHIAPFLLGFADCILVTSFDYANTSAIAPLVKKKAKNVAEIPNSVDTTRFFQSIQEEAGEPTILFVGGLDRAHYFKGVDVLLQAISRISDTAFRLVIVGDGDLRAEYESRASQRDSAARVTFLGTLHGDELFFEYNRSTVVVLPSLDRSEAFGVVLIEAGACGKPVIASDLPGVRSVVDDGRTGFLVKLDDAGDLAEKIALLLNDPERARRMGEAHLARVRKIYSNEKVAAQLLSIMHSLQATS